MTIALGSAPQHILQQALQQSLQQLTPQLSQSVDKLLRQMTQTMTPSLDSLINQLIPLKPSAGSNLLSAAKAGVIQAVVLSNSTLTKPSSAKNNSNANVTVTISSGKQQYELSSQLPIPVGSKVLLKLSDNNLAVLLKVIDAKPSLNTSAKHSPADPATLTTRTVTATTKTNSSANAAISTADKIEQALRQALPQQQSLKVLLPLLQKIVRQPPQHWPKNLNHNIDQLLKQFPSAEQLQQPKMLKRALQNSGVFFEAKLAQRISQQQSLQTPTRTAKTTAGSQPVVTKTDINADIKGLMQRIVPQIEKASASPASLPSTLMTKPPSQATTTQTTADDAKQSLNLYSDKPTPPVLGNPAQTKTQNSNDQKTDVILRQLGQQLLASLARTQLNQLESLGARQQNTAESQGLINSWNLELPIVHGNQVDHLQLKIDQQEAESDNKGKAEPQKQWTVTLNFDLHSLGKMNVQLKIIEHTVAATVWSQLEYTHQQVKQHMQLLRGNLEKVGVTVKNVDCQLGLPPKTQTPIYRQLVDIRT